MVGLTLKLYDKARRIERIARTNLLVDIGPWRGPLDEFGELIPYPLLGTGWGTDALPGSNAVAESCLVL